MRRWWPSLPGTSGAAMSSRIRQALVTLLVEEDRPMSIIDPSGQPMEVTMRDVEDIMQACGCSESEALDRLAGWIEDNLRGRQ